MRHIILTNKLKGPLGRLPRALSYHPLNILTRRHSRDDTVSTSFLYKRSCVTGVPGKHCAGMPVTTCLDESIWMQSKAHSVSSSSEQPQKSAAALNTTAVRAINRLMKYVFIVQFLLGMDIRYLAKDHSMTTGKWSEGYFCEYEVLTIAHDCTFVRPLVTKIWSMREALAGGVEIYL